MKLALNTKKIIVGALNASSQPSLNLPGKTITPFSNLQVGFRVEWRFVEMEPVVAIREA